MNYAQKTLIPFLVNQKKKIRMIRQKQQMRYQLILFVNYNFKDNHDVANIISELPLIYIY